MTGSRRRVVTLLTVIAAGVTPLMASVALDGRVGAHVPDTPPTVFTILVPGGGAEPTAVTTGVVSVLAKESGWRGVWVSATLRSFGPDPQPSAELLYEACTAKRGCETVTIATIGPGEFPPDVTNRDRNAAVDRHYGPGQQLLSAALILRKAGLESRYEIAMP